MKMHLDNITKPFNTNINGGETTAKINMDSFAFEALSGRNLYKDIIVAMVRELSCNAWDSHVKAGKKGVPFIVHLPTKSEPYFSVQDFGVGLDDQGVRDIFFTWFGSTKRDDNEVTGAWGLGSKTPFGYSDSGNFMVTAIKDGMERTYVIYKNDVGQPAINLMCENETTKENGVEVQVPVVDMSHIDKFKQAAESVFVWFQDKPTTNIHLSIVEPDYIFENVVDGCHFIKNRYQSKVIQSNVAYNIDYNMLNLDSNVIRFFNRFNGGFIIEVENGSVQCSMSREELSYTKNTISVLSEKLTAMYNAAKDVARKMVKDKTLWEVLDNSTLSRFPDEMKEEVYTETFTNYATHEELSKVENLFKGINYTFYRKLKVNYKSSNPYSHDSISPRRQHIVIVVNDLQRNINTRYIAGVSNQLFKSEVIIVVNGDYDEVVDRIKAIYGDCGTIYKTSGLSYNTEKKDRAQQYSRNSYARHIYSNGEICQDPIKLSDFDDSVRYYVPLKNRGYDNHHMSVLNLVKTTFGIENIYGLNSFAVKDVSKLKNWVNVETLICDAIESLKTVDRFKISIDWNLLKYFDILQKYEDISVLKLASEATTWYDINHIKHSIKQLGMDEECVQHLVDFEKEVKETQMRLHKKYELLNNVSNSANIRHIEFYIKGVNLEA